MVSLITKDLGVHCASNNRLIYRLILPTCRSDYRLIYHLQQTRLAFLTLCIQCNLLDYFEFAILPCVIKCIRKWFYIFFRNFNTFFLCYQILQITSSVSISLHRLTSKKYIYNHVICTFTCAKVTFYPSTHQKNSSQDMLLPPNWHLPKICTSLYNTPKANIYNKKSTKKYNPRSSTALLVTC